MRKVTYMMTVYHLIKIIVYNLAFFYCFFNIRIIVIAIIFCISIQRLILVISLFFNIKKV